MWFVFLILSFPYFTRQPPANIERIVSLTPSLTEIVFDLEQGKKIIGVTRYDNFPLAVVKIPKVGGFVDWDVETIVSLKPDLLITIPTSAGRQKIDTLARLGIATLVLPAQNLADLWLSYVTLGKLFRKESFAAEKVSKLKKHFADIQKTTGSERSALVIIERHPLIAASTSTYFSELLTYLKLRNVVVRGGDYPLLDKEAVMALKPDIVLDFSEKKDVEFWQMFSGSFKVVHVYDDRLLRLGPRLPEALNALAERL